MWLVAARDEESGDVRLVQRVCRLTIRQLL